MRVKIIECCNNGWYKDQIGSIMNVTKGGGNYYIAFTYNGTQWYIEECDCEILPDEQTAQPKPFDLDRALKGEKVITRHGREVTEIRHFETTSEGACSIAGVLGGHIFAWRSKGDYTDNSEYDLFMAPKEPQVVTRWVNVYKSSVGEIIGGSKFYSTKEDANTAAFTNSDKFVGSFPLTITLKPKP